MTESNMPETIWAHGRKLTRSDGRDVSCAGWCVSPLPVPATQYVRRDLATPAPVTLAAAMELPEVAALVAAVECDLIRECEYNALPVDRGGESGPNGLAFRRWKAARADVLAALAALKGGDA